MAGEVTFAATEADNIDAQRDWWRSVVFRRKTGIRYTVIVAVALVIFALFGGWDEQWPMDPRPYLIGGAIGAVYAILALGLCLVLGYLLLPRRAARLFRQAKMAGQPWTFSWDDDGLSYVAKNGTGRYRWLDFDHWHGGRRATLCFIADNSYIYLPHRVLDVAQRDDVTASLIHSGLRRG